MHPTCAIRAWRLFRTRAGRTRVVVDGKSLPASVLTIRTTLVNRRQVCAHVPLLFKSCLDRLQVGSRYRLLKVLGHGSFSCVTLAEDTWTGEHVRSCMRRYIMHGVGLWPTRDETQVLRRGHSGQRIILPFRQILKINTGMRPMILHAHMRGLPALRPC